MRITPALLILAAVASACATAPTSPDASPSTPAADAGAPDAGPPDAGAAPFDLKARQNEARKLLEKQSKLYWKNWTTGAPIDVAATYQGHAALFSLQTIAGVQAAERAEPDPMKKRALRDFELYLDGEHLNQKVAGLNDKLANIEATATVNAGADVPYRNVESLLANEPSHAKRVALAHATLPVLAKLNPLLEEKESLIEQGVGELGYDSYGALAAAMRDADLGALAKQAEAVLTETDATYKKAMAEAVHRELGLDLAEMRRADIPRFFHAQAVQSAFPATQMMPRFTALLAGMGIDLAKLGLTIDAANTPKKNPRAVCFPIVVPTDVRLSIKPAGGVDDYAQLYHEGGHALHFASTTTPVWAFQQLGNATVTEAYAFLLEDRLEDPAYLRELGMTGELLQRYVRSAAVKKLYMLRRYAAKVLLEEAWHGPHPLAGAALRTKYQALLSRAYGFPVTDDDAARYLADHDDFFYSADYLRAWFLAAQLDADLARKFGPEWWHSADAGKALRGLMSHGNGLTAEEVARSLGDAGLSEQPLMTRLQQRLQ